MSTLRRLLCVGMLGVACRAPSEDAGGDTDSFLAPTDPLTFVDPLIATGGRGAEVASVTPAATWPNGLTSVGPDTAMRSGTRLAPYHCAGYHYDDDAITAFSMLHAHGMGVVDYGGIPWLARDGWRDSDADPKLPILAFSHDRERATPGRYSVHLDDDGIDVDIVASVHGAHFQFTWPEGADPVVELDLGHVLSGNRVEEAFADVDLPAGEISGKHVVSGSYSGRFGGVQAHFVARFDPPPEASGAWSDPAAPQPGEIHAEGPQSGLWVRFPAGTTRVHMRVAVSYASLEGARANLEAELPDTDLQAREDAVREAWRDRLDVVRIDADDRTKRIFYTALYHSLLMPSRLDDVEGTYRGLDQEIHHTDRPMYSDLSLWDTYRTLHPLYLLLWPDLAGDVAYSLVQMGRDGGVIPRWPLAHGYTGGMVGTPQVIILAESWLKGALDEDLLADALAGAQTLSDGPTPVASRSGALAWVTEGYLPIEDGGTGSASKALEYAWSDAAFSHWFEALGQTEAASIYRARAEGWKQHFDPEAGFITGRYRDGRFEWSGNPDDWSDVYVEGNAWHYRWMVPWDPQALIDVEYAGDRDAFHAAFADYWEQVRATPDTLGADRLYWHGNEPVMNTAFLGSLTGAPDLTTDAAWWILAHKYDDTPLKGLDGNDDAGTLSAWYIWGAMGLFPTAGTLDYALSTPILNRTEIHRKDGWNLVIRAPERSPSRRYLTRVTLAGQPLDEPQTTHQAILDAGEIVFETSENPGQWGR